MATVHVYVTPKSGRDEVAGWRGGELSIRVTAPPEDGKATAAVCKLLAKSLGVAKGSVRVTRGDISRHKTLEIAGVSDAEIDAAFGERPGALF
jgi:uncharacterized protein (TIGR00251 family)